LFQFKTKWSKIRVSYPFKENFLMHAPLSPYMLFVLFLYSDYYSIMYKHAS